MLNKTKLIISIILLAIFLTSVSHAQDRDIRLDSKLLQILIQKADTHILLKMKNGSIYALDSKRNTIYPAGYIAPSHEVFYVFDVSYLKSLLANQSNKKSIAVDGNKIMLRISEEMPTCPPHCP